MRALVVLVVLAALGGCTSPSAPAAQAPEVAPVGAPAFATPSTIGGGIISETTLALRGDTLLVCGNANFGPEFVLASLDGGASWQRSNVSRNMGPAGGSVERSTDCDVDVAPEGTWYDTLLDYAPVGLPDYGSPSPAVVVGASRDHGASWTFTPVPAVENVRADRPYIHALANHSLYLTHKAHNENPFSVWFQRSDDDGAHWSAPTLVAGAQDPTLLNGNVGKMVVSPDGRTIRIPIHRFSTAAIASGMSEQERLDLAESTDAGATWTVRPITGLLPLREDTFLPSLAASDHRLYATVPLANGTSAADLAFVTSADDGVTWSKPIPFAPAQGYPRPDDLATVALDAGPNGTMDAAWFHWAGQDLVVSAARFDAERVLWTRDATTPAATTPAFLEFLWLAHDAEGRMRIAYPLPLAACPAGPRDCIEFLAQT